MRFRAKPWTSDVLAAPFIIHRQITDDSMCAIAEFAASLRRLNVGRCHGVSAAGLLAIARRTGTRLACTNSSTQACAPIPDGPPAQNPCVTTPSKVPSTSSHSPHPHNCSPLEALCVDRLRAPTNDTLVALAEGCPALRRLEALGCSRIGGAGLVALAAGCNMLGLVDVRECPRVSAASISAFRRRLPHCELYTDDISAIARAAEGHISSREGEASRRWPPGTLNS